MGGGDELPEFSVLDMLRRAHALASEQASEYVDRFWPTDADVVEDVGLASFAAYIAAPEAGNMPLTANENGAIRTVAELKEILSSYIYRLLVHAAARHAPFNGQSSVNLVRNPPDASGGYMVSPSGDDFVTCQGGRLSPTNIEW